MDNKTLPKILTEEELRFRESVFQDQYMGSVMSKKPYQYSQEIIASHRSLLSANAELSWYKNAYKQTLKAIADSTTTQIEALRSMAKSTLRGDDNE